MKFGSMLLGVLLVLSVIPMVVIAGLGLNQMSAMNDVVIEESSNALLNAGTKEMQASVEGWRQALQNYIDERGANTKAVAGYPEIAKYFAASTDTEKESIMADIETTFVTVQLGEMIQVGDELIDIYCHISLTDPDGNEIACTCEGEVVTDTSKNYSDEQWFQDTKILEDGKLAYGNVLAEVMETGGDAEDMIHISTPIYDGGELIGLLDMRSHYFIISMMIEHVTYADTGYLYIVDEEGTIVSHPVYSVADGVKITDSATFGSELSSIATTSILQGETALKKYTSADGEELYISYASLTVGDSTFSIIAMAPASEFIGSATTLEDEISSTTMLMLIIVIVTAAVVTGIGIAIIRSVSKPVVNLTDVMNKVRDGNFDVSIKVEGTDEIKDLCEAAKGTMAVIQTLLSEKK